MVKPSSRSRRGSRQPRWTRADASDRGPSGGDL